MKDLTLNVDIFEVIANGRTKRFDASNYAAAEDYYFHCKERGSEVQIKAVIELED